MCSRARGSRLFLACALAVAAACGGSEERATLPAAITSVEPARASAEVETAITIRGTMPVKPVVSMSGSTDSTLDTGYRAWLGDAALSDASWFPLVDVRWVDAATLTATVPATVPAGAYALIIESPFGERTSMEGFQVAAARAALTISAEAALPVVRVGERVVVTVTVHNAGQAAATGVTTAVAAPPGFTLFTSPTEPLDIPGGDSRSFTWTYTAEAGAGNGTFAVTAAGLDSSSGESVSAAQFTTNSVAVAYAVGGTVSGLDARGTGLVLRLNGANDLAVAPGATTFSFPTALPSGNQFAVTIAAQPSGPTQTCTVSAGTGTVGTGPVTVVVNCNVNTFTLGGNVAGLVGSGLVLREATSNQNVAVTSAGTYAFTAPIPSGRGYNVTVATQPTNPTQTCTVANGTGTVGSTNVTNVNVTCTTSTFSVGGTVSGLAGSGLVLLLNGVTPAPVAATGPFSFPGVPSGTQYSITVQAQPANPTQTCVVANGTGTVGAANVTNVNVTCTTASFALGGTVSGLAGTGLVLRNGASTVSVPANATSFELPPVPSGTAYNVVVQTQPSGPTQQCTVTNGSGTMGAAAVTNVVVTCVTSSFTVGGAVSGLSGSGLVLLLNGQSSLPVSVNGAYSFPAPLQSGTPYTITVQTQPANPTQTCLVANGTGTVGGANVTNVNVACTTATFTVGGAVTGLQGRNLRLLLTYGAGQTSQLQLSAGDPSLPSFTFNAAVPSGAAYLVTVAADPSNPRQTCTVANGSGTVGAANVSDVAVTCGGSVFTLTTTVTGSGSLLCNGATCAPTADYPAGTVVQITPETGTLTSILVDGAVDPACTTASCQVTMIADHSVTATFAP